MRVLYSNLRDQFESMSESERKLFIHDLFRRAFRTLALCIALGMVWMIWAAMLARGVTNRNALESSQAARHLLQGHGFTTSVIRPLSLNYFPVIEHHPDLTTPPFMTVLKASLFAFAGASDRMVYLASGLGWITCALLIFFMVRDLTGRRAPALYAVALWCLNIAAAQYAVDGDNVMWSAGFMTAVLCCMYRAGQRAQDARLERWTRETDLRGLPWNWALLSGLSATLLTLCEPRLSLCAWLPLLWFWLRWPMQAGLPKFLLVAENTIDGKNRKRMRAGYRRRLFWPLLLPGLILLGLWYGYGLSRTGPNHPGVLRAYMAAAFSTDYPGESIFRYATTPIDMPLVFWFGQMRHALTQSLRSLIPMPEALLYLAGIVPLAFFVAGLFMALDVRVRSLRRSLYVPFLLTIVSMSLWSMNARYMAVFTPCLLIIAVLVMHLVLGARWKYEINIPDSPSMRFWVAGLLRRAWYMTRRHQIYGLFLLLAAMPAFTLRMNLPPRTALAIPPGLDYLIQNSRTGDVILTDDPWNVAWYAQRTAVWLPQREQDMDALEERGVDADWIYLNNAALTDPREIGDWWPELVRDPAGWQGFTSVQKTFDRERVMQKSSIFVPLPNAP